MLATSLSSVRVSVLPSALTSVFDRAPALTPDPFSHRSSDSLSRRSCCPPIDPACLWVSPPGGRRG
jgi:hypothetical protein